MINGRVSALRGLRLPILPLEHHASGDDLFDIPLRAHDAEIAVGGDPHRLPLQGGAEGATVEPVPAAVIGELLQVEGADAGGDIGAKPADDGARSAQSSTAPRKLSYKDQRDYDLLPGRIDEIDAAIARDENALGDPDLYAKDPDRFAALTQAIEQARAEREAAEERWLALAEQVEAMAG